MTTYTVTSILTLYNAESPEEAAQKAIAHFQHLDHQTTFNVEWPSVYKGEVIGKVLIVDHSTHEVSEA